MSIYPSKDKWLTHSGGDMGYPEDRKKKATLTTKPKFTVAAVGKKSFTNKRSSKR